VLPVRTIACFFSLVKPPCSGQANRFLAIRLIYLHHRRGAAGAEALDGEQGEFAVGCALAYLYAQLATDVVNLTPTIHGVLFMKPSVELGP